MYHSILFKIRPLWPIPVIAFVTNLGLQFMSSAADTPSVTFS